MGVVPREQLADFAGAPSPTPRAHVGIARRRDVVAIAVMVLVARRAERLDADDGTGAYGGGVTVSFQKPSGRPSSATCQPSASCSRRRWPREPIAGQASGPWLRCGLHNARQPRHDDGCDLLRVLCNGRRPDRGGRSSPRHDIARIGAIEVVAFLFSIFTVYRCGPARRSSTAFCSCSWESPSTSGSSTRTQERSRPIGNELTKRRSHFPYFCARMLQMSARM